MVSLKELEKQVKTLITEERWAEAYKLCNQILSYDPENTTFIRLRNQIEKDVKNINRRNIKNELEKLEIFLKNHQYEEYLKQIAPLQTYIGDFPEIGERILYAKKLLDQQYQQKKDEAFQEIYNEIKSRGSSLDFGETLQKLDNLLKLDIHPKEIRQLQKKIKKTWIDLLIKENMGLLQSQKFEDSIIFLLKLQKIDSENIRVKNLISKIKNSYQLYKVENKKDYIFKTIEEIKTLYITKSYEKCIELCERVLDIDPSSPIARSYLRKAINKADKLSQNHIFQQILENYHNFPNTKDYREGNYIRV